MKDDTNKTAAQNFLNMITSGQIDSAYEKYVDLKGVHHNVFTPSGFPALLGGMKENDGQFPDKKLAIKQVVAEGDMVVVYSHLIMRPGDTGMAVVHIFRFSDGKIVELWDCGQALPDDPVNTDGPF